MKRLITFLFVTFALLSSVQGQAIIPAGHFHRAVSSRTYSTVLNDGNTKAWYEYGDGSSTYMTDDGSVVSVWKDQSGTGENLANADGTDLPTKDAVNEELDFDGEDDNLYLDNTDISQPYTLYFVVRQNSRTTNNYMMLSSNNIKQGSTDTTWIVASAVQDTHGTVGSYGIITVVHNGASSVLQWNAETETTGNIGANALTYYYIGYVNDLAAELSCKELIIRAVADSESDRTLIRNYLNAKYTIF